MPTVQLRDIVTYYEEHGSGDPLVLIMGLGGDLQAWARQIPALSKHFRVITFDNRGAGRTSAPDKPYSIAGMAEDTAGLMDHLGIERAHVLGLSMGGMIAQELALSEPGRVDRLILVSTAASIEGYVRRFVEAWMNVRRSNMSREQILRLTAVFLYSDELLNDDERFEQAIAAGLANPYEQRDHAFLRQAKALLAFDATGRLKNVQSPVLVTAAAGDILIPPRNSKRLAELLPNAQYKELPGGHAGVIEYADDYNAAFLEFLGVKK
ncbi:MAG: alpha/beta hydrolase [Dehalococcoidia bacterium]